MITTINNWLGIEYGALISVCVCVSVVCVCVCKSVCECVYVC